MTLKSHKAPRPRGIGGVILRWFYYLFLAGGISALMYVGYIMGYAYIYQAWEQRKFESTVRNEAPAATSRPGANDNAAMDRLAGSKILHAVSEGDVIGEMKIDRLNLKVVFVQGDSEKILHRAVGHLPNTAMPGENGNVVLAGHRDGFFRPLRDIKSEDMITLSTLDGEYQYQVDSIKIVSPSDVQAVKPTKDKVLTLVTCFPFYFVGAAPKRFIVRAREIQSSMKQ